jgi:hypothetical protein
MTVYTLFLYIGVVALLLTALRYFLQGYTKVLLSFLQNFVGTLFVFSGFVKAVDPMGTSIKMHEYFEAMKNRVLQSYLYNAHGSDAGGRAHTGCGTARRVQAKDHYIAVAAFKCIFSAFDGIYLSIWFYSDFYIFWSIAICIAIDIYRRYYREWVSKVLDVADRFCYRLYIACHYQILIGF